MKKILILIIITNFVRSEPFSRYPYISMIDRGKIAIAFKTAFPCSSRIIIEDLAGNEINKSDVIYDTMHVFYFNVPPGTYRYLVFLCDSLVSNDKFTFKIPSSSDSVVSFLIFGDSGTGGTAQFEVRDAIYSFLKKEEVDFLIHTGDVVYPNGEPWLYDSRYFNVYRDMLCNKFSFLTPGNHDYYYDTKGVGYFSNFFLPVNEYGTEEFYSFSWGNVFFVSLNITGFVDYAPGSKQYSWLIRVLSSEEAQRKKWKIVFFHIPPFSTTRWHDIGIYTSLFPVLKSFKVNLILCGHVHGYERGQIDGIEMITSGGGGAYLHHFEKEESKIIKYSFTHNFCWIKIIGDSMFIFAFDKNNKVIDSLNLQIVNEVTNDSDSAAKNVVDKAVVFPNPFNSSVSFVFNFHPENKPIIYIYDMLGRFVSSAELIKEDSVFIYSWNGKDSEGKSVASGVYIAVINIDRKRFSKKILKIN